MASIKVWLHAARLRTLPLAASGILCGAALAWYNQTFSWVLSALALLTALLLQVLSNFANDYGDAEKGTDNEHRVGPMRTIQSGALSLNQMKHGMVVVGLAALFSGTTLIAIATTTLPAGTWVFFLVLGLLSIAAAVMYTVGKRAYGYNGLGDIMVFLFFGIVSVLGTYYLNASTLTREAIFLSIGIGCLSTGVLNLNNMRDIDNDITSGKMTIAARLGYTNAKLYHMFLIVVGCVSVVGLAFPLGFSYWTYALLVIPVFKLLKDLKVITNTKDKALLDPFLKQLSLGTFFLSIVFVITLILNS